MKFETLEALKGACLTLPTGDETAAIAASDRQDNLTKPRGSLGRLEELAIWLARWQKNPIPKLNQVDIHVFAGSHGVTARGVSAYPADVTAQMVANYQAGGAAINQLAQMAEASLHIIPLMIDTPTADFTQAPALSDAEFLDAVEVGYDAIDENSDLVCLGEMGIGNTTVAAALAHALLGGEAHDWTGLGTGVDDAGLARKIAVINEAVAFHRAKTNDTLALFQALGGRELAAMFGATLSCRQKSIPMVVDGFVASAAVLPLMMINPSGLDHAVAGHVSAENAHRKLLTHMKMPPLLDLNMRLGEGSGAALAVNILRGALVCHSGMATFAEAGVSTES